MTRIGIASIYVFVSIFLLFSAGCSINTGDSIGIYGGGNDYIVVFNRVDELLIGDLVDTVSLGDLAGNYKGRRIIGLGTTSLDHCGELMFMSGSCYWADPTQQGRIVELDWTEKLLPFCAIVIADDGEKHEYAGVNGDIHQWLETKMDELGIPLAAIEVKGNFDGVLLSIADKLPSTPADTVQGINVAVDERQAWEFVGFYAFGENNQELISTVGHPVHLHGKTIDGSHGGHLQQANAVGAEVIIYALEGYVLRNRVPSL